VTELDRDRLGKLLGLLGSTHDGEVLAAARQAERMRREAGTTWPDILAPGAAIIAAAPPKSLEDQLQLWAEHFDCCLNDWERRFFRSISRSRRPLSEKQIGVVADTAARLSRSSS
jgi:hypothetical protein